jgi:hypothetical protein
MPQSQKKPKAIKINVSKINKEKQPTAPDFFEEDEKSRSDNSFSLKPLNIYRKIAFSFIILTALLLGIIFYFSFARVTIKVEPREERLSDFLNFDLHDSEESFEFSQKDISGIVKKIRLEEEMTFEASGEEIVGEEIVGEVTIINNNNKNQILVATTRLLTPDNKLFRIKKTVNVPAGGRMKAEIYADDISAAMAIPPSSFTIPGLWAGLQDKIYAKSDESFIYRKKINKYVQKADIDNAAIDLKKRLLEKAKLEFEQSSLYDQIMYELDENSIEITMDAKAGNKKEEFRSKAIADVVVIAYNSEKIVNMAKRKLETLVPDNKKLLDFNNANIVFSVDNYNADKGIASISAVFEGKMILEDKRQIIDRNMIVGLNKSQLESYLSDIKEIQAYQVSFSPSFINKVPKLIDRIKIE